MNYWVTHCVHYWLDQIVRVIDLDNLHILTAKVVGITDDAVRVTTDGVSEFLVPMTLYSDSRYVMLTRPTPMQCGPYEHELTEWKTVQVFNTFNKDGLTEFDDGEDLEHYSKAPCVYLRPLQVTRLFRTNDIGKTYFPPIGSTIIHVEKMVPWTLIEYNITDYVQFVVEFACARATIDAANYNSWCYNGRLLGEICNGD